MGDRKGKNTSLRTGVDGAAWKMVIYLRGSPTDWVLTISPVQEESAMTIPLSLRPVHLKYESVGVAEPHEMEAADGAA